MMERLRGGVNNMHSCRTCWFNITDYDERDRAYHYCHLTLEPIKDTKTVCKDYKHHDKKNTLNNNGKEYYLI